MRNLNSILLEGSLLDDPIFAAPSTADAPAKCTFTIGSEPDAPSVPVVVYGRLAAFCSQAFPRLCRPSRRPYRAGHRRHCLYQLLPPLRHRGAHRTEALYLEGISLGGR